MQTMVSTLQAVVCNIWFGHSFVNCARVRPSLPRAGDAIHLVLWSGSGLVHETSHKPNCYCPEEVRQGQKVAN